MKCNFCGSEESDIIAEYTRFEKRNVLKCRTCNLVFLEMSDDRNSVESFYASDYRKVPELPRMSPEEHFCNEVTRNDTRERIKFISGNVDLKGKKVLEIGSASGSLMTELAGNGCGEVVGIELGREYAEYSRSLGFQIYERSLEELELKQVFDAVVSFHTIEHVFDPVMVFHAVYTALKPGGMFLGEVPNQDDWRIKIFNDETAKRFHYDPNHYYYFSPETLSNYLTRSGFTGIRLETVERYNSLVQLRNILCPDTRADIEVTLRKYIFPADKADEVRLPDIDDTAGLVFNEVFGKGVNSGLMGNCLRWAAKK